MNDECEICKEELCI